VAWTSAGTQVSEIRAGTGGTTFRVDQVGPAGGVVVLRLLGWPGYTTSLGSVAAPVDGYLLTVHLPASAAGHRVDVHFRPPGWPGELAAWALALACGTGWSLWAAARRRSRRAPGSTEPGSRTPEGVGDRIRPDS
jgi:hypothetical protein